jgi:uncharacterized protein (TIGR00730 family)
VDPGAHPEYLQAARQLGNVLGSRNIGLVYGGGNVGMMGEIADAVHKAGGEIIGVIPKGLFEKGVAFSELPDLRVVNSMHERKALMIELADGFIALPGGLGTMEEFFEVLAWAQLGIHRKPCGILNIRQYYDRLMGFLDHSVEEQFVELEHRMLMLVDTSPEGLLRQFEEFQPPVLDKVEWVLQKRSSAFGGNTNEKPD